jgi:hypothetical protein
MAGRSARCARFELPALFREVVVRRAQSIVGALVFLAISFSPQLSAAQSAAIGGSYTLLSLAYPDEMPSGLGAWLSWDLVGSAVGLDVAANIFPDDHPVIGRQTEFLAGVRSGVRIGQVGLFGRVRPGLVHFSERFLSPDIACIAIFPTPEACLTENTNFALDLGGIVELYPTQSTVVRIDVGDTVIRFDRSALDPAWKHNFQFSAGGGVRF